MKYLLPFFLFLFALVSFGCDEGNIDMDNDGEETFVVTLDDISYNMSPGDYQNLKLPSGSHRIIIKDENGKILEETSFNVEKGGLINLARTDYYIWTDLYGDPALKEQHLKEDWLKIGNQTYFGEFIKVEPESIYKEKSWDYGLSEDFPSDLLGWQLTKEKYILKSKIFRKDQLIAAYNALAKESPTP